MNSKFFKVRKFTAFLVVMTFILSFLPAMEVRAAEYEPELPGLAGIMPVFGPRPIENPPDGTWGEIIWDEISIFYGTLNRPEDDVSVGDYVTYGFTIRGMAGNAVSAPNRIRTFNPALVNDSRNINVTNWITLDGDINRNIGSLGLSARIINLELIPNASGSNASLDITIIMSGYLAQAFSGDIGFVIPAGSFGFHGAFSELNGEPYWLTEDFTVEPGITINRGAGVAIEGYFGGSPTPSSFTVEIAGHGFADMPTVRDITSWVIYPDLESLGIKLTVGPVEAGAPVMTVNVLPTVEPDPLVPDSGITGIIDETYLDFRFPPSAFRTFGSAVYLFAYPEDPTSSTIEILPVRLSIPVISEIRGPRVNNGRRIFRLGEELEINDNPAQNFTVTVEFDGKRLREGIAPDADLAETDWRLVGVTIDEDGEIIGSPREIFEAGYVLSAVGGASTSSNAIQFSVEGTVLTTPQNWTDLMVIIPGSRFTGIIDDTYVKGALSDTVPPTTNPPRTVIQYAVTADGNDPQRGVTSSGVTITGRESANLAHSFNDTFTIGLDTRFEFRTDLTNSDVTRWINVPRGVTARIVSGGEAGDPDVTVEFVGTPSMEFSAPITVNVSGNVLTNLATRQQASGIINIESNNNFWDIGTASNRRAVLSPVAVSGMVDGSLDQEYFTMTITLTEASFSGIIAGVSVGGFTDNAGNPNNPNALFYRRVPEPGNSNRFVFEPLNLDEYNISATMRGAPQGAQTAVVEFRRFDESENPEGTLPYLLAEPIYIGFGTAHLTGGGRYTADSNGVILYTELNEAAVFDIQPTGMSAHIHGFAGNPVRGSETNGIFELTLPYHPMRLPNHHASPTRFINLPAATVVNGWFGDSLPTDATLTISVLGIINEGRTVRLSLAGDAGTAAFNRFANVVVPGQFVSTGENTRIRNLDSYVSVAAAEIRDTTISGRANEPKHPTDIYIYLHGLRPGGATVTDDWFKNPDGTPFFDPDLPPHSDPELPPSGLRYNLTSHIYNLGTEDMRNDVHQIRIRVTGTPAHSFSGPFILDIPDTAFLPYTSPVNPEGADALPEFNTVYTFPTNIAPATGVSVTSNTNPNAVFAIGQGEFTGTVRLEVSPTDLRGGAGVYRTVTVTTTNASEDIWLRVSGSIRGTTHRFTELVRIPVPEFPATVRTIRHNITVSSDSDIEISVIRRTNPAETIPNLTAGNYELVDLTPGPIIRRITMLP